MKIAKFLFLPILAVAFFAGGCFMEDDPVSVEGPIIDSLATRPFPQAGQFTRHGIRPNNSSQTQMNADVKSRYDNYRRFLDSVKAQNGEMRYWIKATGTSGQATATISEAHGYGMLIFALMAGARGDEKKIFDGLNRTRKAFPSVADNRLMAWQFFNVATDPDTPPNVANTTSATDGCLDNAYALLLAHRQWGEQQYLNDAIQIINGLKASCMHINQATHRIKLGDWHARDWVAGTSSASNPNTTSRSSDWRPAHFRAFAKATGDNYWNIAADTVYSLLRSVAHPTTGLMPDFAIGVPARPVANESEALVGGEHNWGSYAMNAFRTPWQLALDYTHNNTQHAKTQMDKISNWIADATGGSPSNMRSGYTLDGRVLTSDISTNNQSYDFHSAMFAATFASGMLANSDNQSFLNNAYNSFRAANPSGEYDAALQLLNMILITGNWWVP